MRPYCLVAPIFTFSFGVGMGGVCRIPWKRNSSSPRRKQQQESTAVPVISLLSPPCSYKLFEKYKRKQLFVRQIGFIKRQTFTLLLYFGSVYFYRKHNICYTNKNQVKYDMTSWEKLDLENASFAKTWFFHNQSICKVHLR